jgi:hypothetical protein
LSLLSPSFSGSAPSPGIAASLRNQLEGERGSGSGGSVTERRISEGQHRSRGIVIEDDEDVPDVLVDDDSGGSARADDFTSESADHETVQTHPEPTALPQASIPSPLQIPKRGSLHTNAPLSTSSAGAAVAASNPPLSPLSSFPTPPLQQTPLPHGVSEFLVAQRAGGGSKRESLFLPHPNAPKPSNSPSGPMYARQQSPMLRVSPLGSLSPAAAPTPPSPNNIPGGSSVRALHQAQAAAARFTPNGQMRRTTIYGRCDFDLKSADGPVPIAFSLEPLLATPPPPPSPSALVPPPSPLNIVKRSPSPGMTPLVPSPLSRSEFSSSAPQSPMLSVSSGEGSAGGVIMRPGFFPQAKGPRPRSRSFSGFNSGSPEPLGRR